MKNKEKMIASVSKVLLAVYTVFGASMYFVQNEMVSASFEALGYPNDLVYPLAIAKIAAIVVILFNKSAFLRSYAYAGLSFVFILGAVAHVQAGVGSPVGALIALALLVVSYKYNEKCKK